MGENFAFFLPIMMASFGVAFLIVWSWRVQAAGLWSAAFFCVAAAFSMPAGFSLFPTPLWRVLADLGFATGFLLFSEALLKRWRPGWMLAARLAIWGLSVLLCTLAITFDHLRLELVASDFSRFLLIGLPLIVAKGHLHRGADRTLFAAAALVALDNLIRGSSLPLTLTDQSDFSGSYYAFLMQAVASIFGLFLALAALATQVTDVLARYQRDAMIDPLSGLLNRRGFEDAVARLAARRARGGSLIVCDIDHFKAVNDQFGHALGDRVIHALAVILNQAAPVGALAARFGGEEFVLFLPEADAAHAAEIANGVRERFAQEVGARLGIAHALTASFGLSTVQRADRSIHDTIARADEALYDAKAKGRNRVCVRRALSTPDTASSVIPPRFLSA